MRFEVKLTPTRFGHSCDVTEWHDDADSAPVEAPSIPWDGGTCWFLGSADRAERKVRRRLERRKRAEERRRRVVRALTV